MALDPVQQAAFIHTFTLYRASPGWTATQTTVPGYFYTPRSGLQIVNMGGEGAPTESMEQTRMDRLLCQAAVAVQAQDIVKAVSAGARSGKFFNVRAVIPNDGLANQLECVLDETRDLPDGVS